MKRTSQPDPKATEATRKRYQRIAPLYDLMEDLGMGDIFKLIVARRGDR